MRKLAALPLLLCTLAFARVKIQTFSLPSGAVGAAYSATIQAPGGTLPYTWWVQSGALPAGLSLVPCTQFCATIAGTPTSDGNYSFSIEVRGHGGMTSTVIYTMAIAPNSPPGSHYVTLNWHAVSGAASYNVYRGTTKGGPYAQITSGIGLATYTDDDVTAGTTYYYVVTDVNDVGEESGHSNEVQAVVP
jgi:hypothetical protein